MVEMNWSHLVFAVWVVLSMVSILMNPRISGILGSWLYILAASSITIIIGAVAYYGFQSDLAKKDYQEDIVHRLTLVSNLTGIDEELFLSMKRFLITCYFLRSALASGEELTSAGKDLLVRVQSELRSFDHKIIHVLLLNEAKDEVDEAKAYLDEKLNNLLLDYDESSIFTTK